MVAGGGVASPYLARVGERSPPAPDQVARNPGRRPQAPWQAANDSKARRAQT